MPVEIFTQLDGAQPFWSDAMCRSPFETHLWNSVYSRHFDVKPHILVARDNGNTAILPLKQDGRRPRILRFLSVAHSDYQDVLLGRSGVHDREDGRHAGCLSALLAGLKELEWELLEMAHVPEHSVLLKAVPQAFPGARVLPEEVCPVLALPDSWDVLLKSMKKKTRDKLKYYAKRAGARGGLEFQCSDRPRETGEAFETHLRLHRKRWAKRALPGVFYSHRIRAFHRDLSPKLAHHGLCRLYTMNVGGQPVGSLYGFPFRDTYYLYSIGYDPEFAEVSPGFLLVAHAIEDCISRGFREFDFLRGEEDYKFRWKPAVHQNYRIVAGRGHWVSKALEHKSRLSLALELKAKQLLRR